MQRETRLDQIRALDAVGYRKPGGVPVRRIDDTVGDYACMGFLVLIVGLSLYVVPGILIGMGY
jgi:hypothetical protein